VARRRASGLLNSERGGAVRRWAARQWKDAWPARTVALATVAYGVAITVAPKVLAAPTGLLRADGGVSTAVAALTRSIGTRDAAVAAALALAPAGYPIRLLTAARVVSDLSDAVWLTRSGTDRATNLKIIGVAAGWAALEAVAGWHGGRAAVPSRSHGV
jgi:hypothetical protein